MTTATATTLIDQVLPGFDFQSRHSRHVNAPPEWVAQAVELLQLGPAATLLFKIRGIELPSGSIRDVLTRSRFTVLAEDPGVEVVAGTQGQFWAINEMAHMEAPADLESFRAFDRPGWAQGVISLRIEPRDDGTTDLITETRVRCTDETARRRFAVYWAIIRPFSGWLRQDFLRRIALIAEGTA